MMYSKILWQIWRAYLISTRKISLKVIAAFTCIFLLAQCDTGYGEKNGKKTFNGQEITDKNFVVLSPEFARDSTTVYYKELAFEHVDLLSFKVVDEHYAKDTNTVFYCDEYREGQNYYMTKKQTILELENADPASFVSLQHEYAKDKEQAWFQGKAFKVQDLPSLRSIDINFVADKYQAYINRKPISGSDGNSFSIINYNFAKDKSHYYYYGFEKGKDYTISAIPADVKTFEIIDNQFSKDQAKVFYKSLSLKDAQPGSFSVLQFGYAKDAATVYYQAKKINDADPASFQVYEANGDINEDTFYAKDNNSVYVNDQNIIGADVKTFKSLGSHYGSDGIHIFYKASLVNNAQASSFKVSENETGAVDAEDGRRKFYQGVSVK